MPSETSTACADQSVEELRRELAEAREQQAATAEILRVISSSPMDLPRVFAEMATSAARLCNANDAQIRQVDGTTLRLVAQHGSIPSYPELKATRGLVSGRAVLERRTIQVTDLDAEPDEYPEGSAHARRLGYRTMLAVPLIRAGAATGVINIRRIEARPFSDKQIALLQIFADQAVIAIENTRLFEEVQARNTELRVALEQQTATSELLKVIGRSTFNIQPVFDTLAENAVKLCEAQHAFIFRLEGQLLRCVATYNISPALREFVEANPVRPARGSGAGRAALERRTIQIEDIRTDPEFTYGVVQVGPMRTLLAVPMLRADELLGVIVITRPEVRLFTNNQIALMETFADQAVIAIENARLFEAEQTRTRELTERTQELTETLEYQTATSEVLGVISRSPNALQPVLDAMLQTAGRLCEAEYALFFRLQGGKYHVAGSNNAVTDLVKHLSDHPINLDQDSLVGRTALERRTVHLPDCLADPAYTRRDEQSIGNYRSMLGVPLIRDDVAIGVITLMRNIVEPFTETQIKLVTTFADQALIAIENTRLFEEVQARTKELQESLDRQTATSEVLGVISRSPNEVQPVLDTIVATAQRLCQAERAVVWRLEGETFRAVAHHGQSEERVKSVLSARRPLSRGSMVGRATLMRRAVQVEDVATDPELVAAHAFSRAGNIHTILAVPLLLKGEPIGGITLARTSVARFDDKQVALVESFADQAVIAIENSRLFEAEQASKRELTESLEQQTATADVLKVISRSALDLQRVLDALVESAARLCNAYDAAIFQVFGDGLRLVAHHGQIATVGPVEQLTIPVERGSMAARAVIDRRTIQVADMLAEGHEYPESRKRALQNGHRTALAVPLVHAGEAMGVILMRRGEVRPFVERQVELVNTFADQAVIAIENARLFEEVQARTRELAKTVEDLEIASQHKNQFVANMSHELRTPLAAILGYAELIQEGFYGPQPEKSMDALTRIRSNGKHLLGLINTVLDIAKIESGQFTLNMSEYAIESVVETVRSATESLAQNKKLALKTEVAKSLPVGLGDEQRLTQVLLNLVGNAIKFTDTGEVCVTAKAVNGHFNVSVTDTGPGIPAEHQTRIFEQFHQVDSSNTKAKGGTGLGLAIAKQIVEMHGGRIWVESTLGKGSTFQMELPTRAELRKPAS